MKLKLPTATAAKMPERHVKTHVLTVFHCLHYTPAVSTLGGIL